MAAELTETEEQARHLAESNRREAIKSAGRRYWEVRGIQEGQKVRVPAGDVPAAGTLAARARDIRRNSPCGDVVGTARVSGTVGAYVQSKHGCILLDRFTRLEKVLAAG